ncbi:hypothetical protein LVISKB_1032 [Levilactobacillus brevis KB290]|uniref:Uncharacterized protein n=1 Tax=Levilactobacillus brevis KB290 TaxID=1001583 RepID=M5AE95_LEVBR|nr:hypothetical protein LVISKB_1032 [Levilactobacillus brevis KB290]
MDQITASAAFKQWQKHEPTTAVSQNGNQQCVGHINKILSLIRDVPTTQPIV